MSFRVTMYKFSKRSNSTLRPSGGRSFQCTIKAGSGVLYPTINLDLGGAAQYPDYNYAYIPDFDRYYYIQDMINRGPIWEIKLKVDPLASWRDTIGSTSLYILRSSAEMDGNIMDTYYPASSANSVTITAGTRLFSSSTDDAIHPPVEGCIICGIVSKNANIGSLCYYAVPYAAFDNICAYLTSDTLLTDYNFDPQNASFELQKSLINPLQYIKTAMWLPGSASSYGSAANVVVFNWDTQIGAYRMGSYEPYTVFTGSLNVANHPQISRGRYLNLTPYTITWLDAPPFGTIQIDSSLLRDSATINYEALVDHITGVGSLRIKNASGAIISTVSAQVGVPVNMSQVTMNYLGAASNTIQSVAGVVQDAIWGNVAGAVSGAAAGIASAANSLAPRVQSMGGTGSFSALYGRVRLFQQFFTIADEDLSHNGRPLCKVRTPSTLGGFMMVLDGDISAPATDQELSEIRSYLEEGFYWE